MNQHLVEVHQQALAVAKRILSGTETERYELGVPEPADNSRLFNDLVALAEQQDPIPLYFRSAGLADAAEVAHLVFGDCAPHNGSYWRRIAARVPNSR